MKTLRFILTLLLSVALAAGVMTAIQSCSKDEGPGGGGDTPEQKFKITMTCTQKEFCYEYALFDVLCTAERSVYKMQKYFYYDTVPYSGVKDENHYYWCEGVNKKNSIEKFVPNKHYVNDIKAEAGQMVVLHPFNTPKKLYIGAYVVSGADTVWSEPFVYDAPMNPGVGGAFEITELTTNSFTVTLRFTREVTSDEFKDLSFSLGLTYPYNIIKTPIPFEGKVSMLKVTFDNLTPNTLYRPSVCFTLKISDKTTYLPTQFITTPAE